jgi:thiamine biosynthesis protein ThiI
VTRAELSVVLDTEARLPTEELLALALKDREVALFTWPGRKALEEGASRAFIMEHGPA